ncbi:hypothetical protein C7271_10730, partial [filamentous cyanobacterium CCP5]
MDGLALTYLWEIYADPGDEPPPLAQFSVAQALRPGALALAGMLLWGSFSQVLAITAYVDTPPGYALNIRWGPGTNYGIWRTLLRGTPIEINGIYRNGWAQLSNGTWVAGNLISTRTNAVVPNRWTQAVVVSGIEGLNARWGPGTGYGIYRTLAPGERVIITGRSDGNWAQLDNGTWVAASFLEFPSTQIPAPEPTNPLPENPTQAVVQLQNL